MKLTGLRGAWKHFVPASKQQAEQILMKVSEVATVIGSIDTAIQSISTEVDKVAAEVQALKDSLSNVDLPPEAQAAIESLTNRTTALASAVKKVDDIIPDNPTPTP